MVGVVMVVDGEALLGFRCWLLVASSGLDSHQQPRTKNQKRFTTHHQPPRR
jgi:hypothetical protein